MKITSLRSLSLALLLAVTGSLFAQPANDDCSGAVELFPSNTCNPIDGDVGGTTQSVPAIWCDGWTGVADDDVWYKFTATETTHAIQLGISGDWDPVIDIRSGGCDGTNIDCVNGTYKLMTGLNIGETYYVRIYHWEATLPSNTAFTICLLDGLIPPPNDDCSGAIELIPSLDCNMVFGDVANATESIPPITCNGWTGVANDDVWYRFTATDVTHTIILGILGTWDPVIDIRSGGCNGTNIACGDTPNTVVTGLTIGETYYVRIYHWFLSQPSPTSFGICLVGPAPATCDADAGTLSADSPVCLVAGSADISATPNGDAVVPPGYETMYVLTQGMGQVIVDVFTDPAFTVNAADDYAIHTLVYDPNTLDLSGVLPGVTPLSDITDQLIQGGGSVCGSSDVSGAAITVQECTTCDASAGSISPTQDPVCLVDGAAEISGVPDGNMIVPPGYEVLYLLSGSSMIQQVSADPVFTVDMADVFTIHTLVYDPATFDPGTIVLGASTIDEVNGQMIQGGGTICGSLDQGGASIMVGVCVPCDAVAGTSIADVTPVCLLAGEAQISATPDGNGVVPDGYAVAYLLSQGPGQLVMQVSVGASFTVTQADGYAIHELVYDPNVIDLGVLTPGETSIQEIIDFFIDNAGFICGSIDPVGAVFVVEDCNSCLAEAGGLTAVEPIACLVGGMADLSATPDGNAVIPVGYEILYVLTQGPGLVIMELGAMPTFSATQAGDYAIHTLVHDPNTLDLSGVVLGSTPLSDIESQLIQAGGLICGSLDVTGAAITVQECVPCDADAGTLTIDEASVCLFQGTTQVGAMPNGDIVVPDGYEVAYALSQGANLTIVALNGGPVFPITVPGTYLIHTLVYDPNTIDVGLIELGLTTGFDIYTLLVQGGGDICGAIDLVGATVVVNDCAPANDDCISAFPLPINAVNDCPANAVSGDNTYATMDGGDPSCDDPGSNVLDMWYTFNSGENTEVTITLDHGTMEDWAVVVTDGCGGNELICLIQPVVPIVLTTDPFVDYIVRVYSNYTFGNGGQFGLCISGDSPSVVCDGGTVQTGMGSFTVDVCQDTEADIIDFLTSSVSAENYEFILTDDNDQIIAVLPGGSLDFNSAPLGLYRVWGVSFNGTLVGADPGELITALSTSGSCVDLSDNYVLVNVEICDGLASASAGSWNIFPNPGSGDFSLSSFGIDGLTRIDVVDMNGRTVHSERRAMVSGQPQTFHLRGMLAQGVYSVRLTGDTGSATLRLIVQ